jgi:hypothetical protein
MRRPNVSPSWELEPRTKADLGAFTEKAHTLCRAIRDSDPDRHSDALIDLVDVEDDDEVAQAVWLARWFPTA